jgi:uncharacterized protein YrrD
MVRKNDIIGKEMITLQNGKKVGEIKDVIYDPKALRVKALVVKQGGLLRESKVVLMQEVHSIGEDAVIIETESLIRPLSQIEGSLSKVTEMSNQISEATLITEEGKNLGDVQDVFFDPSTGKVEEFEVRNQKEKKRKNKRIIVPDIVTVGEDVTVVRGYGEKIFDKQIEQDDKDISVVPSDTVSQSQVVIESQNVRFPQQGGKSNAEMDDDNSLQTQLKGETVLQKTKEIGKSNREKKDIVPEIERNKAEEATRYSGKSVAATFADSFLGFGPWIQTAISQITGSPLPPENTTGNIL